MIKKINHQCYELCKLQSTSTNRLLDWFVQCQCTHPRIPIVLKRVIHKENYYVSILINYFIFVIFVFFFLTFAHKLAWRMLTPLERIPKLCNLNYFSIILIILVCCLLGDGYFLFECALKDLHLFHGKHQRTNFLKKCMKNLNTMKKSP